MGNAKWTGVRLRDVLDRAGVKAGAVAVRFNGLDQPVVDDGPDFMKSLDRRPRTRWRGDAGLPDERRTVAAANGFPLRLVVPGWYSTYWVKMLNDIEVLDAPDTSYWMAVAYRIPDTPGADVKPGQTGFKTVPINRMVPRSFITNLTDGTRVQPGAAVPVRGIAFGGDCGGGARRRFHRRRPHLVPTTLGPDAGRYSFRQWTAQVTAPASGALTLMVRCTNTDKVTQPAEPTWNPAGFMRNVIESVHLSVA